MKNEDFEDVYQKYHKFSVRNARKIVKDRMAAEDISQDVFFRLYQVEKPWTFHVRRCFGR